RPGRIRVLEREILGVLGQNIELGCCTRRLFLRLPAIGCGHFFSSDRREGPENALQWLAQGIWPDKIPGIPMHRTFALRWFNAPGRASKPLATPGESSMTVNQR